MKSSRPKLDEVLIDDLLIDELVSGQLTGERYRAALRALDTEPAKWRDCALAFLEEQALRTELRDLSKGTIDWSEGVSASERTISEDLPSLTCKPQAPIETKVTSSQSRNMASINSRSVLSTAALLLISFTVGWLGSEVWVEHQQTTANPEPETLMAKPADLQPAARPNLNSQFVVDQSGGFDRGIPGPIRELERDGRISVKTYDMIVPTILNDGSRVYMPVQEMILGRGKIERY